MQKNTDTPKTPKSGSDKDANNSAKDASQPASKFEKPFKFKPNNPKAGLPGMKNSVPITPTKAPTPAKPTVEVDWTTPTKQSSPQKASRPAEVIRRGPDSARLAGLPTTSSIELRIFGLPHYHTDDAMNRADKALSDINKRNGKLLPSTDPAYIHDPKQQFKVYIGEPFISGPKNHQSSVKIRFSDPWWLKDEATMEGMEKLREALVEGGHEVYWSTANKNDKRNQGVFYFTPEEGRVDNLDANVAGDWAVQLVEENGHPSVGHWGDFKKERQKNQRLSKTIKFAHPPSVQKFAEFAHDKVWDCEGYTVNYEPPQNVIYPNNPATIATTNISSVDPEGLIAELWGFIDEYVEQNDGGFEEEPALLDDHRVDFGKFFVVSCSTIDLAHFLCSKFPVVGTQYELVYELNDRGLVTADRARDNEQKYKEDQHEARESSAQVAYQMVKDQSNMMKKLSDRMDRTERQRLLDRREDAESSATMFCMTQESSDLLMKQVAADQEIRDAREARDKFEAELRSIEETIDDFEGDETPKGKKKYNRALSQRERVDLRVAEQISSLRKAVLARDELRNFKSPWKQRLLDRFGNTIREITDASSNPQAVAPSTTLAIQALEQDDQMDSHGPTKKTKPSEADSTGKETDEEGSSSMLVDVGHLDISGTPMDLDPVRFMLISVPCHPVLKTDVGQGSPLRVKTSASTETFLFGRNSCLSASPSALPSFDLSSPSAPVPVPHALLLASASAHSLDHCLYLYIIMKIMHRAFHRPKLSILSALIVLIILMPQVQAVPAASSAMAYEQLRILTLNCNGFGENEMKSHHVYRLLVSTFPHILILTETRQKRFHPLTVPSSGTFKHHEDIRRQYQTHHEPAATNNSSTGVTILIRNDVNIKARVNTPKTPHGPGRIAAVDLSFPDMQNKLRTIRVIGIYAPTAPISPRDSSNLTQFWNAVSSLITPIPHDWVVGGDVNAFLHRWEETGGTFQASYNATLLQLRKAYCQFLAESGGSDVWANRMTTRVEADWTCTSHNGSGAKKILDRYAISQGLTCRLVTTLDVVPYTNHRPVSAVILTGVRTPAGKFSSRNLAPPRLKQPQKADATQQYEAMNDRLGTYMQAHPSPPPLIPAEEEGDVAERHKSFDKLMSYCDKGFMRACNHAFDRPKPATGLTTKSVKSKETTEIAQRVQTINRLITAVREDRVPALMFTDSAVRHEWREAGLIEQMTRTQIAAHWRKLRNKLTQQLRKAARSVVYYSGEQTKAQQFRSVLKGGSLKRLFDPHHVLNPQYLQRAARTIMRSSMTRLTDATRPTLATTSRTMTAGLPPSITSIADPLPRARATAPTTTTPTDNRVGTTVASDPKGKLKVWHAYFEQLHRSTEAPNVPKPWLTSPAAAQMKTKTATDDFVWPQTMTLEGLRVLISRGNPKPSPGPDSWEKWALRKASDDFLLLTLHLCNYMICANYFSPRLKQNFISPLYKRGDLTDPSNYRGIVFANCLYNVVTSWFTQQFQKYIWRRKLLPTLQIATQQGVQPGDLTNFLDQVHTAGIATGSTFFAIKRDHTKGFDNLHAQGYYDALKFYGINSAVAAFEEARTKDITLYVKSFDGIGKDKITTTGQTKQGDHPSPIKYTLTMSMLTWWLSLQGPLRSSDIPVVKTIKGQNGPHHTPADHFSLKLLSVEAMDDSVMFGTSWTSLAKTVEYSERFQDAYGIQTAWDSDDKTVCFTLGKDLSRSPETVEFKTVTAIHQVPFTDQPKLLRTTLHNQAATADIINSIIDAFPIPTDRAWPMAILRRAVSSLLVSRIRPRLHLQPLTPEMANEIDHAISRKVTTALDLTHTRSAILSLPTLCRGFGFPSLQVMNGEVAVTMMLRSLNHHLPEIRIMAQITMANWQCAINGCIPPLESLTEHTVPRAEMSPHACVPAGWIAAAKYLRDANLPIVETDQSYLYESSIEHLITRVQNQTKDVPPRWAANRLRALQTPREANDPVRKWIKSITTLSASGTPTVKAARDKITHWLGTYPFEASLHLRDTSVFTAVSKRKAHYSNLINAAFKGSDNPEVRGTWASDGSHKTLHGRHTSTTAAVVGKAGASFKLVGQYGSSLHAERLGLIAALMNTQGHGNESRIITDHLNSVRDVARVRGQYFQDDGWRPQPAHELYKWLLEVIRGTTAGVSHIKAHTDAEDADSRLNNAADREAGLAHHNPKTRLIPALTAWMRPWVAYVPGVGFAQDNWKDVLNIATMEAVYAKQSLGTWRRTDDPVRLKPTSPPEYFYKHSPAGLTAKYQFLMRTGGFLTNERTAKPGSSQDASCQFCGHKLQDEQHLFVDCPHFEKFRDEALRKSTRLHAGALAKKTPDRDLLLREFEQYAEQTIRGTAISPTQYWIGSTPPVPPPLGDLEAKMAHHLAITLASRIAGAYQRDKAKERGFGRGTKRDEPASMERHEREEGEGGRGRKRPRE